MYFSLYIVSPFELDVILWTNDFIAPPVQGQSEDDVWFDVGVFKVLFSEVTHYYLPADEDQETMATTSRPNNTAEVHFRGPFRMGFYMVVSHSLVQTGAPKDRTE